MTNLSAHFIQKQLADRVASEKKRCSYKVQVQPQQLDIYAVTEIGTVLYHCSKKDIVGELDTALIASHCKTILMTFRKLPKLIQNKA